MNLEPITRNKDRFKILYDLLSERTPEQSISHKEMPTFKRHTEFVNSYPYLVWYFVQHEREILGTVYLTRDREIGIFLFKKHIGKGFGTKVLEMIMKKHPGTFLANCNPENEASIRLFKRFGFELVQHVYRC